MACPAPTDVVLNYTHAGGKYFLWTRWRYPFPTPLTFRLYLYRLSPGEVEFVLHRLENAAKTSRHHIFSHTRGAPGDEFLVRIFAQCADCTWSPAGHDQVILE